MLGYTDDPTIICFCEKNYFLQPKLLIDLFFGFCALCGCIFQTMAAIPQGMFAACKVRENNEKILSKLHDVEKDDKYFKQCGMGLGPMKYSSKLMNSIWGMYNRYSVHNFKKNIDEHVNIIKAWNQQM